MSSIRGAMDEGFRFSAFRRQGLRLPEEKFEEIWKNVEDILETKFPALLNGTNIIELQ